MQYAMMGISNSKELKMIGVSEHGILSSSNPLDVLASKYKGAVSSKTASGGTVKFNVTPADFQDIIHQFTTDILSSGWEPFAVTDSEVLNTIYFAGRLNKVI